MDITELGVKETVNLVKKGEVKALEIISSYFEKIDKVDKDINAFISVFYDRAVEEAKKIAKSKEKSGTLLGAVVAVKDNILVKDFETNCRFENLKGFIAPYDATVVKKLKSAGAIVIWQDEP